MKRILAQIRSELWEEAKSLGFEESCSPEAGRALKRLAKSDRGIKILELGTGVGVGTTWLLEGMHEKSTLTTVEMEPSRSAKVRKIFHGVDGVNFLVGDAESILEDKANFGQYDLVFADTKIGKMEKFELGLNLLRAKGVYILDDMKPAPDDPEFQQMLNDLRTRFEDLDGYRHIIFDKENGIEIIVKD